MQQEEVEVSGDAPKGQMSVLDALKGVLKLALMHDGLARGLREASKALDRRQAHMCVLNENCEEEAYKKLVIALCSEHKIPLIKVPDGKQLGEWAGLCTWSQDDDIYLEGFANRSSQVSSIVRVTPARSSTALALLSRIGVRSPRSDPSSSTTSRPNSKRIIGVDVKGIRGADLVSSRPLDATSRLYSSHFGWHLNELRPNDSRPSCIEWNKKNWASSEKHFVS